MPNYAQNINNEKAVRFSSLFALLNKNQSRFKIENIILASAYIHNMIKLIAYLEENR